MALFKNSHDSHQHSLEVLNKLVEYDSFLDSLTVVADMGCGAGLDSKWWAELTTRDEPPEPRNYIVYAVDQNTDQIESDVLKTKNVIPIQGNFEKFIISKDGKKVVRYCNSDLLDLAYNSGNRTINSETALKSITETIEHFLGEPDIIVE